MTQYQKRHSVDSSDKDLNSFSFLLIISVSRVAPAEPVTPNGQGVPDLPQLLSGHVLQPVLPELRTPHVLYLQSNQRVDLPVLE